MSYLPFHFTCTKNRFAIAAIAVFAGIQTAAASPPEKISYIDNHIIRIGIDLSKGGTIVFLADSNNLINTVNTHDMGRMIQQSYYSGPSPFGSPHPAYPNWGWNPVGAGDVYGFTSQVVSHSNDGHTLYTKSIPKQWALHNVPAECTFEQWIELNGSAAKVRCRLSNARTDGTTQYPGSDQELPAVYTQGQFYRLFSYTGSEPFSGGALTQIQNVGPPWAYFNATENWSALVQDNDWGLGVFSPGVQFTVGGFHNAPGGNPTGYVSPLHKEILDHNITYEYEYYLMLGYLNDIRGYVYRHRPTNTPDYHFKNDRQHFIYENAADTGWPIAGKLRVNLNQANPIIYAPPGLWKASDIPILYIRASYHSTNTKARIYWKNFGDPNFTETKSLSFNIVSDGKYRNYAVNLALSQNYTGVVTQIRFDPAETGAAGDYVDIEAISYKPLAAKTNGSNDKFPDLALFVQQWLEME
jgi:hypothetical protein